MKRKDFLNRLGYGLLGLIFLSIIGKFKQGGAAKAPPNISNKEAKFYRKLAG